MVNFTLMITAELENLTNLQPQGGCDDPNFPYLFKVSFFFLHLFQLIKCNFFKFLSVFHFRSSIFVLLLQSIVEMWEMRRTQPERNLRRLKRHRSSSGWKGHHSSHSKGNLIHPLACVLSKAFFFHYPIQ